MSLERRGSFDRLWRRVSLIAPFALFFVGASDHGPAPLAPRSGAGDRGGFFGPAPANADVDWGYDTDSDGLPDEIELLVGGSPLLADSDGDGFGDGVEFVCDSRIGDPTSTPKVRPATRAYAYESNHVTRVFCAVYPANLDMVSSFHCVAGSPNFTRATEGDPGSGLGIVEITAMLPGAAHSYTLSQNLMLNLVGFSFDLDRDQLLMNAPVSIGFAAKIADVVCCDEITITTSGSTNLVLGSGPVTDAGFATYAIQPLDPTGGEGEDPEYCALGFDAGTPVGVGSIEFSVTTAGCEPDGLLYCVGIDCTALQGQKLMMIDYGFLQSKANQ